jgi:hypothetical protein
MRHPVGAQIVGLASSGKCCILSSDFNLLKGVQMTNSEIEAFFLKAMRSGYAGGSVGKTMTPSDVRPSTKEIRFQEGDFLLIDEWNVNRDTNKSTGVTRIWYDGTLVWFMSYGGYYPDSAIKFLKGALGHQYSCEGSFRGGRGPARCVVSDIPLSDGPDLTYVNECQGDFERFSGKERILAPQPLAGEVVVGHHEYWGMSLL